MIFGATALKINRKLAFNNVKIEFEFQPNPIKNKKLRFYGEIFTIMGYFTHIFPIYLYWEKYEVQEKMMLPILFVEICSEMPFQNVSLAKQMYLCPYLGTFNLHPNVTKS